MYVLNFGTVGDKILVKKKDPPVCPEFYVLRVDVTPLDGQRILRIPSTCSYLVYLLRCFITGQSRSVCSHLHVYVRYLLH